MAPAVLIGFLLALSHAAFAQTVTTPPAAGNSSCVASMWCNSWSVPYVCECACSCGAQCVCAVSPASCNAPAAIQYWPAALCNAPTNFTSNITQAFDTLITGQSCALQFGGTMVPIGSIVTLTYGSFYVTCSCPCYAGCQCPCTVSMANSSAPVAPSIIPMANCPTTSAPPCTCPVVNGLNFYAPVGSYANLTFNFGNGLCMQVVNAVCACSCPCTTSCLSAPIIYSCSSNTTNSFTTTAPMTQTCPNATNSSISVPTTTSTVTSTTTTTTTMMTTTTTTTTTTVAPNPCTGCFLTTPAGITLSKLAPGTLYYWSLVDSSGSVCSRITFGCPCVTAVNNCTTCTCNVLSNRTAVCNGTTTIQTSSDPEALCFCPSTMPTQPASTSAFASTAIVSSTPNMATNSTTMAPSTATKITSTSIMTPTTPTLAVTTPTMMPTIPTMAPTSPTMAPRTSTAASTTSPTCYYCNATGSILVPPGATLIMELQPVVGLPQFAYVCPCACACNCSCTCTVMTQSCPNDASMCLVYSQCPLNSTAVPQSSSNSSNVIAGRKKRQVDNALAPSMSSQFLREIGRFTDDQAALDKLRETYSEPFRRRHNHWTATNSQVRAKVSFSVLSGLDKITTDLQMAPPHKAQVFLSSLVENYLSILFGSILGVNFKQVGSFHLSTTGPGSFDVTCIVTISGLKVEDQSEWSEAIRMAFLEGYAVMSTWNSIRIDIASVRVQKVDSSSNSHHRETHQIVGQHSSNCRLESTGSEFMILLLLYIFRVLNN